MNAAETPILKAPFPSFGGKSRVALDVWARIGADVDNAVEPFCRSLAWILKRPGGAGRIETVNDLDGYIVNFWRAVKADPEAVAHHADHPVLEVDLHARHRWLVGSERVVGAGGLLERLREDPDACDAKVAGWWCWGACCWIGAGWCDTSHRNAGGTQRPALGTDGAGNGVHRSQIVPLSRVTGQGVTRSPDTPLPVKLPHLDAAGRGVQGSVPSEQLPHLDAAAFGGMSGNMTSEDSRRVELFADKGVVVDVKRPHLATEGAGGRGVFGVLEGDFEPGAGAQRSAWIRAWMRSLSDRLREVRVCCGEWDRVCDSPSTMTRLGTTGVFLDPPYRTHLGDGSKNRAAHIYGNDRVQDVNALCDRVQAWCLKWAGERGVRIALCGLEGEYPEIERLVGAGGWSVLEWSAAGGYGNQKGGKNDNRHRERVWFSPHCLPPGGEKGLFS